MGMEIGRNSGGVKRGTGKGKSKWKKGVTPWLFGVYVLVTIASNCAALHSVCRHFRLHFCFYHCLLVMQETPQVRERRGEGGRERKAWQRN
jgi:hypothetical protein